MSAKQKLQEMKDSLERGAKLTSLKVPHDMYEELIRECHPMAPSDYFDVPITVAEQRGTLH